MLWMIVLWFATQLRRFAAWAERVGERIDSGNLYAREHD